MTQSVKYIKKVRLVVEYTILELLTFAKSITFNVPRYFLRLSYNGSGFSGWQIQENATTVQEVLNSKLTTLLRQKVETTGCGRTDAGVHATQFYAHFDTLDLINDTDGMLYSLNAMLPSAIAVYELIEVEDDAHARFDATSRSYKYYISFEKNPFLNQFLMTSFASYNLKQMNVACTYLLDHSDFSAFSKSNTQVKTNICKISNAGWESVGGILVFSITADRFLRGMVRAIVGTMLEIGIEKIKPEEINTIIQSKDRSNAGTSVPACGLYLTEIHYPYIGRKDEMKFPF